MFVRPNIMPLLAGERDKGKQADAYDRRFTFHIIAIFSLTSHQVEFDDVHGACGGRAAPVRGCHLARNVRSTQHLLMLIRVVRTHLALIQL